MVLTDCTNFSSSGNVIKQTSLGRVMGLSMIRTGHCLPCVCTVRVGVGMYSQSSPLAPSDPVALDSSSQSSQSKKASKQTQPIRWYYQQNTNTDYSPTHTNLSYTRTDYSPTHTNLSHTRTDDSPTHTNLSHTSID